MVEVASVDRSRSLSVPVALVALLALLCGCRPGPEADDLRSNVLLVVVDTLRADHLPMYGYVRDTAPGLGRLAESSVVFDEALTVMSHTLPAHISLMTGVHPGRHHVLSNGWKYDGPYPTLAGRLQGEGYATAAFVSSFVLNPDSGLGSGFETYESPEARGGKFPGERTTDRATAWIRGSGDRPFFVFVHYFDTHPQYHSPLDVPSPFSPDPALEGWLEEAGIASRTVAEVSPTPITLNGQPLEIEEAVNEYDNQIHRVDGLIRRLLGSLDEEGELDRTLVIVTSDHGEGLGQHGYYSHGLHLYEEQVRVPLIVKPSAAREWTPRRIRDAVSLLDVVPTVLELTGGSVGPPGDGRSLVPQLLGGTSPDHGRWLLLQRRYFSHRALEARGRRFASRESLHALRGDGALKYLRSGGGEEQMYDLDADPHEVRNLAADRPAEAEALRTRLQELLQARAGEADVAEQDVDAETLEALEALGYVP